MFRKAFMVGAHLAAMVLGFTAVILAVASMAIVVVNMLVVLTR